MLKDINIVFTGGSGGNFLSRCLNLLNNFHCWGSRHQSTVLNLEEKFKLFGYQDVIDKERNWIQFETQSLQTLSKYQLNKQGAEGFFIRLFHVEKFNKSKQPTTDYCFYINPFDNVDWCYANALYKNTPSSVEIIMLGKPLLNQKDIVVVNCHNMVQNTQSFLTEFKKITDTVEYQPSVDELQYVSQLYMQWKATTLPDHKVIEFLEKHHGI